MRTESDERGEEREDSELLEWFRRAMSCELATGAEEIDSANLQSEGGHPIFDHPPGRLLGTRWHGAEMSAMAEERRLVVLVRRDLPWSVRVVQAAHAVANWAHHTHVIDEEWGEYGPSFVVYGVRDVAELEMWASRLAGATVFCEPDLGSEVTALAYHGQGRLEGLGLL